MIEVELKFQVPEARRGAVERAVATSTAQTMRLQARYFDTPDRRLARAGLALRLRQEGPRWVQTLKGRGDGLMQRLEHEVVLTALDATSAEPALDLLLHDGTSAGAALQQALDGATGTLTERYRTDIRRVHRAVRTPEGAWVELAFDAGEIRAGEARLPVCELEFELLRGAAGAVPRLAQRWVARHGLWLDPRSKAERGERLARGRPLVPAVKARSPRLDATLPGGQALRAMLACALDQVLRNACELADEAVAASASPTSLAAHLHQGRVGLRRLRSALQEFAGLESDAAAHAAFDGWQGALADVFRRLGGARDRDALQETLLPALAAAGAPALALPGASAEARPGEVLRDPAVNALWLQLLAYLHTPSAQPAPGEPALPLPVQTRSRLRRLHRRVVASAAAFAQLDEAEQHRVRKRLKRLRYGTEFCAALYPAKAVARYLDALRPAQDALGHYNDLLVARTLFEAQAGHDPQAWFAVGWLAAHLTPARADCGAALARIGRVPTFWRRGKGE